MSSGPQNPNRSDRPAVPSPSFSPGDPSASNFDQFPSGAEPANEQLAGWSPAAPPPLPQVVCRRCGKSVAGNLANCPFCAARLTSAIPAANSATTPVGFPPAAPRFVPAASQRMPAPQSDGADSTKAVTRLLLFYLLLLSTNLVAHWLSGAFINEHQRNEEITRKLVVFTALLEAIDAFIVFLALALIPWPPKLPTISRQQRTIGWLMGPVILAAVLGLNLLYHSLFQNYVQFPHWAHERVEMPIGWTIILVCVQPGIIEELFMRFIALGTLTRVMGVGAAICVSSIMFGMAHSGVLLSIPILTVVGAGLGIVRVWSGSIVLPMLLHAAHNAFVVYLESQ